MHVPERYKHKNSTEVHEFIKNNGFGILINQGKVKLQGTHIPMVLKKDMKGNDILEGHLSKLNPQWKNFKDNDEVLAIFPGPHSYVSSSWYKKENVPTWNYIAVHVYGKIKIIKGEDLVNALRNLVDKYEKGSKEPVSVDLLSCKTMKLVDGIVGFQIEITEIQAAHKLSQNREDADHENIIKELIKRDDYHSKAIAEEMINHKKKNS